MICFLDVAFYLLEVIFFLYVFGDVTNAFSLIGNGFNTIKESMPFLTNLIYNFYHIPSSHCGYGFQGLLGYFVAFPYYFSYSRSVQCLCPVRKISTHCSSFQYFVSYFYRFIMKIDFFNQLKHLIKSLEGFLRWQNLLSSYTNLRRIS